MTSTAKIDFSQDMHEGSKAWKTVWSAGQGVGSVVHRETIAQVVEQLVRDYDGA
jgi:nitronate monooxygenase